MHVQGISSTAKLSTYIVHACSSHTTRRHHWNPLPQRSNPLCHQPPQKSLKLVKSKQTNHSPNQKRISAVGSLPQSGVLPTHSRNNVQQTKCYPQTLKPMNCHLQSSSSSQVLASKSKEQPSQPAFSINPPTLPSTTSSIPLIANTSQSKPRIGNIRKAGKKTPAATMALLKCKFCDKQYTHRSALYKHEQKAHQSEALQHTGNIKCIENGCRFKCRYLHELRRHLTTCHAFTMECGKKQFATTEGMCCV